MNTCLYKMTDHPPELGRTYAPRGGVGKVRFTSANDCPDRAKHTKDPDGYLAWHEWAEKKAKTHVQERCPTCGFWAIWRKRD